MSFTEKSSTSSNEIDFLMAYSKVSVKDEWELDELNKFCLFEYRCMVNTGQDHLIWFGKYCSRLCRFKFISINPYSEEHLLDLKKNFKIGKTYTLYITTPQIYKNECNFVHYDIDKVI